MSAEVFARAFLALLFIAVPAAADVFRSGELRLQAGDAPGTYELEARLPSSAARETSIEWPPGCRQVDVNEVTLGDGRTMLRYRAACDRALRGPDFIRAPWQVDAARLDNGLAIPFRTTGGADRSWTELAPGMLWQGMLHIWLGWDHLAFVLCLCMLARGLRLLALVTAFTIGHSVSLGLAFLDVVSIPVAPTEALIALSMVLVAREGLLARPESQQSGSATGAALLALGMALRPAAAATGRAVALYAAGIVGSFWLLERVAGYGWG